MLLPKKRARLLPIQEEEVVLRLDVEQVGGVEELGDEEDGDEGDEGHRPEVDLGAADADGARPRAMRRC